MKLPLTVLDFRRPPLPAESRQMAADLQGVHVLVVDDEPDTRELVSMVLGNCGAEVRTAASAAEALQLVEKASPDVLLIDIQMPGEDGYCLIRKIRALEREKGLRIRAAALTAYVTSSDRSQALSAGFEAHVAKPVEPAELAAVVAQLAKTA